MNTRPIMLVEDQEDDIRLTKRALSKTNIANELIVFRDGVAALEFLRTAVDASGGTVARCPAVILLDLNLPKMNGLEVLRAIRGEPRLCRLPVVILTSSKEQQDIIKSYDGGANSYIRKPVDFVQFTVAINQLGLYWLVLNEPPPITRDAP